MKRPTIACSSRSMSLRSMSELAMSAIANSADCNCSERSSCRSDSVRRVFSDTARASGASTSHSAARRSWRCASPSATRDSAPIPPPSDTHAAMRPRASSRQPVASVLARSTSARSTSDNGAGWAAVRRPSMHTVTAGAAKPSAARCSAARRANVAMSGASSRRSSIDASPRRAAQPGVPAREISKDATATHPSFAAPQTRTARSSAQILAARRAGA